MNKKRSTKDLKLSSNEQLSIKKNYKPLINFPTIKNFKSNYVKFYTFHAGFKKKQDDLLIVVFSQLAPVSIVYSKTSTPAAPILWDKKNNKGICKVLIVNSGNANAHTGKQGVKAIDTYVKKAAKVFNCQIKDILVASTGVIGEQLDFKKILKILTYKKNRHASDLFAAAKSIMTTDTYSKTSLKKVMIGTKKISIFGFAKGSGMIFPNMGTMLAFIFIEANISKKFLKKILHSNLDESFNSITVDGDTSTNDTLMLFSLFQESENQIIKKDEINKISLGIKTVMQDLSLQVVCDGEGISKLIQINVINAKTYNQASDVAFSIANSQLVKTAIAGSDANWGRVIMAIGKSNLKIIQEKIKLKFGEILVAINGKQYSKINIKKLESYMKRKKIEINIDLGIGIHNRSVLSSDLTHEYIRINADYRS